MATSTAAVSDVVIFCTNCLNESGGTSPFAVSRNVSSVPSGEPSPLMAVAIPRMNEFVVLDRIVGDDPERTVLLQQIQHAFDGYGCLGFFLQLERTREGMQLCDRQCLTCFVCREPLASQIAQNRLDRFVLLYSP